MFANYCQVVQQINACGGGQGTREGEENKHGKM